MKSTLKHKTVLTVAMLVFFSIASMTQAASLTPVYSAAGGFEISMPAQPDYNVSSVATSSGNINLHTFMAKNSNGNLYLVSYSDYVSAPYDVMSTIDAEKEGFRSEASAQITKESNIQLSGFAGKSVSMESTDAYYIWEAYVVGSRLYQVVYAMNKETAYDQAEISEFFNSFRLI